MAAPSSSAIRVRLHFDYAPPAVSGCRMCWMLVDLNKCRVVADLESVIRDKFDLSTGSILSLFIEDCYVPHTESIYVVRDNDCVRVKVDSLTQVNGHGSSPDDIGEKPRKRRRCTEADVPSQNGVMVEHKKKKIKRTNDCLQMDSCNSANVEEHFQKKHSEKREEKRKKKNVPSSTPVEKSTTKKISSDVKQTAKTSKKSLMKKSNAGRDESSDSSDTSGEQDGTPTMADHKESTKVAPCTRVKAPLGTKPAPPPSSSETDSSLGDKRKNKKQKCTSAPQSVSAASPKDRVTQLSQSRGTIPSLRSTDCVQNSMSSLRATPAGRVQAQHCVFTSDGEDEVQLVIRKQAQQCDVNKRNPPNQQCSGKRDDKIGDGGPGGGRGDCRGATKGSNGDFGSSVNGGTQAKQQAECTDSLTSSSEPLQNHCQPPPKLDYSLMPLLAGPPPVGQKIVFKLLELSETYSPEVSDYKEGRILSYDPTTKQVELEVLNASQAPVEPGKFDLVYTNPDGSERVEYAVSRGTLLSESWNSLLEARLII